MPAKELQLLLNFVCWSQQGTNKSVSMLACGKRTEPCEHIVQNVALQYVLHGVVQECVHTQHGRQCCKKVGSSSRKVVSPQQYPKVAPPKHHHCFQIPFQWVGAVAKPDSPKHVHIESRHHLFFGHCRTFAQYPQGRPPRKAWRVHLRPGACW